MVLRHVVKGSAGNSGVVIASPRRSVQRNILYDRFLPQALESSAGHHGVVRHLRHFTAPSIVIVAMSWEAADM